MTTQLWSITAQKGGVSKTTTAVNLAAGLALQGKKILLCDLDAQSNATVHLGIDPHTIEGKGMYEVLTKRIPASQAIIETGREGLHLLPAHLSLSTAELEIASMIAREQNLNKQLAEVRENYDYVLIDCPPGVGLLVANAFAASQKVLLTVQPEFFALYGLTLFSELFEAVRQGCQPDLEIGGVLISMIDPKERGMLGVHRDSAKSVSESFADKVFSTRIRLNARLKEAPSHGKTIFEHAPDSSGAADYMNLAKEMCSHGGAEEARPGIESAA